MARNRVTHSRVKEDARILLTMWGEHLDLVLSIVHSCNHCMNRAKRLDRGRVKEDHPKDHNIHKE